MNTLKTVAVVGVLGVVGYGVYAALNSQPVPETPDWIKAQTGADNVLPEVQHGPDFETPAGYTPAVASPPGVAASEYPTTGPPTGTATTGTLHDPAHAAHHGSPPTTQYPSATGSGSSASPAAGGTSRYAKALPKSLHQPATTPGVGRTSAGRPFETAMAASRQQLDAGQLGMALLTLSILYDDPRFSAQQQAEVTELLDQVAGTVIFSRQHLLEPPYRVQPNERLGDIARRYNVPPELLAKINGITDPSQLVPGTELKVVRGPFNALVSVSKRTLTLWVGGRYAGRFAIHTGPEFNQITGRFVVNSKTREHSQFQGNRWIGLVPGSAASGIGATTQMAIVGMSDPAMVEDGTVRGTIAVSPRHADDLFDILSQGSKVTIRR